VWHAATISLTSDDRATRVSIEPKEFLGIVGEKYR
jgi:hypothetical protein